MKCFLFSGSKNIQNSGDDDLFISADGQVHWPIFGEFKTSCTIDVTYYPFDKQTCIVKIGSIDRSIIFENDRDSIDLDQFHMSVFWDIIEAPAYLNVYVSDNVDFPSETDVTYYLVIKRRTHWLSEVCPLLAFALMTIIPAMVTKPMEKLILQVFCMAGLFTLHIDLMHKLPPTSLVTPSASKYIVSLIMYNLIHLTLTTVMNNRRGCFQWIAQQTPFSRMIKRISRESERDNDDKEKKAEQDVETEKYLSNQKERQMAIVDIFNWIILVLLVLAVVVSTLYFIRNKPY
ncbi:hypothetical protein HA402_009552 [Bradysia odoriphaga]|nr:hypothetical protein HA402_009552 [Bradysia odoriphaga]